MKKKNYLISDYIASPHLINGLKYDLRIYACMTCVDPMRIYFYDEGLVRFASNPYSTNYEDLKSKDRHLTNYSLNKHCSDY